MSALLQVELVLAVIEQRWARTADPSQIRYFIFKVHAHVSEAGMPCRHR